MADVSTIISNTTASITSLQAKVEAAVTALNTIAASWTLTTVTAATGVTLGDYGALNTALANASLGLLTYTSPTLTGVTLDLTGADPPPLTDFDSSRWSASDAHWSNIKDATNAMISGLASSADIAATLDALMSDATRAENPIYQKEIERKQQTLRDAYGAANAATGAKGFTYPNMITVALKMKAQQDFQFSLNESARELVKFTIEWAKNNYQFSVERGISVHQAEVDFNIKYGNLLIDKYKATLSGLIESYKAKLYDLIEKAKFRISEIMVNVDLYKIRAGLLSTQDELKVKEYAAEVNDIVKRLELYIHEQDSIVKNKINAYSAAAQASATMASSSAQIVLGTAQ